MKDLECYIMPSLCYDVVILVAIAWVGQPLLRF